MTWSYSFNPKSSAKDNVRFLVGDTRANQPFLQDEEIAAVLSDVGGDSARAAINCCEAILSQLARSRDETVGQVSISYSQRYEGYIKTLERLQARFAISGNYEAYSGGISKSDVQQKNADPDRVRPDFTNHHLLHRELGRWVGPYDGRLWDGWGAW